MVYFSRSDHVLLPFLRVRKTEIELKIAALMVVIMLLCLFILFVHKYIEKHIIYGKAVPLRIKTKLQLGLYESFKVVAKSKYLGLICILMISYSTVVHLIEGLWLHETSLFYKKNPTNFINYQGKVLFWTGICTLTCSCFGNTIIRKLSWLGASLVTPITTLAVGSLFSFLQ